MKRPARAPLDVVSTTHLQARQPTQSRRGSGGGFQHTGTDPNGSMQCQGRRLVRGGGRVQLHSALHKAPADSLHGALLPGNVGTEHQQTSHILTHRALVWLKKAVSSAPPAPSTAAGMAAKVTSAGRGEAGRGSGAHALRPTSRRTGAHAWHFGTCVWHVQGRCYRHSGCYVTCWH